MAPLSGLLGGHIDQVAAVVPNLEVAMDSYIASMAASFQVFEVDQTISAFSGSSPQYRIRIAVALVGLSSIEIIQPTSGVTFYSKYLEVHGPGIHHIGVYVDSLAKAKQGLESSGFRTILDGQIRYLGEFAYLEAPDKSCVLEPLQLSSKLPLFLAKHAKHYRGR